MSAVLVAEVARKARVEVLAGLLRWGRDIDLAEEAFQEACTRALSAWADAPPDQPVAWLRTVARNWLIDQLRARARIQRLSDTYLNGTSLPSSDQPIETISDEDSRDDQLRLLFLCCSSALSPKARVCLALRTLLGLSTREIARAMLEKERTTAQRIVRAKRELASSPPSYELPEGDERGEAIDLALNALYLVFNEGYLAAEGERVLRPGLMEDALQLGTRVAYLLPFHAEASSLAALLCFHGSRAKARTTADGSLVRLEEQDRSLWDRELIAQGRRHLERALDLRRNGSSVTGPYQLQAAIAALHADARAAEETDWLQIAALYRRLVELAPSPVFELNAAVALAMSGDLDGGLAWVNALERRQALEGYHLLPAVKAGLLEKAGHLSQAKRYYARARVLVKNDQERRFLSSRLEQLEQTI